MKVRKEDFFFVLFCIITATVFALYRCINGDFAAYNGDFQNYNIFRRLLDGQVQYRDFTNYLGTGFVLVNLPFVCVFRSFGESVFITHFTTSILYSFILCISFYTIWKDRKKAYIISSLTAITAFVVLHADFHSTFYYQHIYDVFNFEEQGVSMRTTRAFLPFMLVGVFYLAKYKIKQENVILHIFYSNKCVMLVCLLLGMLTIWSNDYGYSCVICFFAIMVIVYIFRKETGIIKSISRLCIAVLSTFIGMTLSIMVITHGSISDYITVNQGIMEDQFWYFGNYYGKYYTFWDIFSDGKYVVMTFAFFLHAFIFLGVVVRNRIDDDSICRLFLHSVCFGASVIYVLGSGAHSYVSLEVITYILGIGLIGKIVKKLEESYLLVRKVKNRITGIRCKIEEGRFTLYIFGMLLLYCISVNIFRTSASYTNKEEVAGLNINSALGQGLDECAEDISDGTIFSTYAGGVEAINGTFQPSGIDYIIHVLGETQRKHYLTSFTQDECEYVSTLKNEYTPDEYWLLRVNWFFYRELYMYYTPVKETSYSVIWEKAENINTVDTEAYVEWEYLDESRCRIDVTLPDYTEGAYADLLIKYDTAWTDDRLKNGGIRKALCVEDGGEQYNNYYLNHQLTNTCYHLKEQTEGFAIPIYVKDGKGFAYISSYPLSCTKIDKIDISVRNIIEVPEYPLHVTNYTLYDGQTVRDGVDSSGTLLKFDSTQFNVNVLENAIQLKAGDETGDISSIWRDGNYIYVLLQNPITRDKFIYPNKIEVIRKNK